MLLAPEVEISKYDGDSEPLIDWHPADFNRDQVTRSNIPFLFESDGHPSAAWVVHLNVSAEDAGTKVRLTSCIVRRQ